EILHEMFTDAQDFASANLMSKLDGQVDRLTKLISDLLDVTKVSEGVLQLTMESVNVSELIKNTTEEIQRTTRGHNIKLIMEPLPEVCGDKERLGQVLTNLLSNAIKYSTDKEDILVKATDENGNVKISVLDSGIGMSPSTVAKLFTRFFRSDNPTIQSYPDLGLGLFISMEIMRRHKGTILVQSEPGKGSVFTIILPSKLQE
ncbi:MAG: HAMP domain-containing histidine kinase, partial [Bacteroidota bacterium]|nr:HAMP domain-containing histidine kinase [Bacteroidota bacterium]